MRIFGHKEPIEEIWVNVYLDIFGSPFFGANWKTEHYARLAIARDLPAQYRIHVIPKLYTPTRHPMDDSV